MAEEGRVVEELSGGKRILREYDAAGKLLRIRVQPVKAGPTPELPPVEPQPRAESSAARALFGWRRSKPKPAPTPEPTTAAPEPASAEVPPPAPPASPPAPALRVRFEGERAPERGIDVVVAELARPVDEPASEPTPEPEREDAPAAPLVFVEPEPAPAPPARAAASFEILAVEPIAKEEPPREREQEPEPEPIVLAPEPRHEPPRELEPEAVVVLAEREPEPEPEPEPPRSYVAVVPDVDARVDALLSRTDVRAKRRKRAPVPAPVFAPLAREPWEERLDAALGRS